ncbi:MAG: hypothetical protein ACLGH3_05150 [Actinomycetota bacterium]
MLLALGSAWVPARAASTARGAIDWLVAQQKSDGSFGNLGAPADATAEVIATLRSAGLSGRVIELALDRVAADGPTRAEKDPTYAARIILGLIAADEDPRDFRGTDYVAILDSEREPLTGGHGGNIYSEAIIGIARNALGTPVDPKTLALIRASRCQAGGYGYERGCVRGPDTDTTAMVVTMLILSGGSVQDESISGAIAWMRSVQAPQGAFPFSEGQRVNSNSTGLAASMIALLGPAWKGGNASRALRTFATRSGGFRYSAATDGPNLYATVQGLPGYLGAPYPLRGTSSTTTSSRIDPVVPGASSSPHLSPSSGGTKRGETDRPPLEIIPAQTASPTGSESGGPELAGAPEGTGTGRRTGLSAAATLLVLGGLAWTVGRRRTT